MTKEELDKLSPKRKRIKIAEACGWTHDAAKDYDSFIGPDGHYKGGATHDLAMALINAGVPPDYLNSLDAMAEAEKVLREYAYTGELYDHNLLEICNPEHDRLARDWTIAEYSAAIHATAAQRADAFLLTVG